VNNNGPQLNRTYWSKWKKKESWAKISSQAKSWI